MVCLKMNDIHQILESKIVENNDISEHLLTLKKYAERCSHITEFGVRWVCSTWAFIAAKPKKINSYDMFFIDDEHIRNVAFKNNVDFNFYQKNVLEIENFENTELLFLDTLHNYNQVRQELNLYAKKVEKYIILHDVVSFAYSDEAPEFNYENKKGLMPAVQDFLENNSEWEIEEFFQNNNGLCVLKRKKENIKILHVNNFGFMDYMNDMVFHGGRSLLGENYYESNCASYMYKSFLPNKESLYGRGFSLSCRLDDPKKVLANESIEEKIKDKYFDLIVYGSATRCKSFLDLVKKVYKKNEIVFIDGEDTTDISWDLCEIGTYFKRELINQTHCVHPINFSIPKELFVGKKKKLKLHSDIQPDASYAFDNEEDYHLNYASSFFANTKRKSGWDCMRHQEIIANYCFPYFEDLQNCPDGTMTFFPKKLVVDYMEKYKDNATKEYWTYMDIIYDHAKKYLTTEYTMKYILEKVI